MYCNLMFELGVKEDSLQSADYITYIRRFSYICHNSDCPPKVFKAILPFCHFHICMSWPPYSSCPVVAKFDAGNGPTFRPSISATAQLSVLATAALMAI